MGSFSNIDEPISFEEDDINKWLNDLYEKLSCFSERIVIPDYLDLGEKYKFIGINDELEITIDEISRDYFSEGDEEQIDINAYTDNGEVADGFIKLVVGYMHFDEDGGAADGIDDEVIIHYTDIKKLVVEFIAEQKVFLNEYKSLLDILYGIEFND